VTQQLTFESIIAEKAKGKHREAGKHKLPQNSTEALETRTELSKLARVSHDLDLKAQIQQAHFEAELERLRAGYDGCGCADCQELYKTLDLSVYGDRVKDYAGTILVVAGKTGADLWEKYNQPDHWKGGVFFTGGKGYGLTDDLRTIELGPEAEVIKDIPKEDENDGKQGSYDAKHTARKPIIGNNKRIRSGRIVGHKQPNNR